mgnify:CR=1 FL=1
MTQKKLILFMPSIEGGGVEKNFFIISNYLAKKLDKTILITAEKNLSKKIKDIKIIYPKSDFWRNKGRLRKYLICIYLLIKTLVMNKNTFVFSFQANLYAIIICKLFRKKIISRSNSSPSGWSKNLIKNLIYKIGLNLADKLIVNSIEFKNEMKKKFSVNSSHIYNPLNKKEILNLSKIKVKKIYPKKVLKIINVGRLVDQKDQMTLLKAVNEIKGLCKFKLILIGRGVNHIKIKNFIKFNNLNKLVKIFYTSNPFPYMKQADILILSSLFEGLPNVLLEAITLKKFVISASCKTGPKEILDNGKGGILFKPKDFKSLAEKIIKYDKNKFYLNKKTKFAFKRLDRFEFKKNLDQYLKLIKIVQTTK